MILWENCSPKNRGGRGQSRSKYDVMVTITKQHRKEPDERLNYDISFTFRNNGFKAVQDYSYGIISKILPNTQRIYFQFLPDTSIAMATGRTLSKNKNSPNSKILRIPVKSVTVYQIVKNYWIGDYQIQYDDEEGYYYISMDGRI